MAHEYSECAVGVCVFEARRARFRFWILFFMRYSCVASNSISHANILFKSKIVRAMGNVDRSREHRARTSQTTSNNRNIRSFHRMNLFLPSLNVNQYILFFSFHFLCECFLTSSAFRSLARSRTHTRTSTIDYTRPILRSMKANSCECRSVGSSSVRFFFPFFCACMCPVRLLFERLK